MSTTMASNSECYYLRKDKQDAESAVILSDELSSSDTVNFYNAGGGLLRTMDRTKFHELYMKVDSLPWVWERKAFAVDGGPAWEGWSTGQLWNGWEKPYFTKDVAEKLCAASCGPDDRWRYNVDTDEFGVKFDGVDEEDVFESITIEVDGCKHRVYGIGAGSWCWDRVEQGYIVSFEDDSVDDAMEHGPSVG